MKTAQVKQGPAGLHLDQEVDVTFLASFAARHGAEHANVVRAVESGHAEDLLALALDQLLSRHIPTPSGSAHRIVEPGGFRRSPRAGSRFGQSSRRARSRCSISATTAAKAGSRSGATHSSSVDS